MVPAGQRGIGAVSLRPKGQLLAAPGEQGIFDRPRDVFLADFHPQAQVVANYCPGGHVQEDDDPEPVHQARTPAATGLGNHDHKAPVEFVGVHLDALKGVLDRTVDAIARHHLLVQLRAANDAGCLDRVGAQNTVGITNEGRVAHVLDSERPLVSNFITQPSELLEKPSP